MEICYEEEISRQSVLDKLAGVLPPARGFDRSYRRKDGTTFPVLIQDRLFRNPEGKIIGIHSTIQDITDRKQAEAAAKRLAHENSVIAEIGRIISSTLNIEEVYKSFAEKVRELIRFDRIAIGLINADENTMRFPYTEGLFVPGRESGDVGPLLGSTAEKMLQTHAGMIIAMESEEEIATRVPALLPDFRCGIRSALTVPLISGDRVIGTLALRSTLPGIYTEQDLKLVESIGNQIAGAIANAQLYGRLKETEESLWRSEEKFRDLFDNAPVGYHELDMEGRITNVNRTDQEMLGYSREEMIGEYIWKFNVEEDIAHREVLEKLAGLRPPGHSFERTYRRKDGTTLPVLLQDRLNKDEQGRITGMRVAIQDITEQKRAEEALQESEERYRPLFENMLNGFAYCRMLFEDNRPRDFIYLLVNNAFEQLTGLKDVVGKKVSEVIPGIRESDPELLDIYGRVALTGIPEKFESYVKALKMWFSISVYSPRKEYFVVLFDVITERKQAEEALREAEENFRRSLDESPLGVRIVTTTGEVLYANQAILDLYGYGSIAELRTTPIEKRYTLESYAEFQMRKGKRERGEFVPSEYEISILRKDGEVRHLQVFRKEVLWNGERQFQTVYLDITERKRAEEALNVSETRYRRLFESAKDGILILDAETGKVVDVNPFLIETLGSSQEEFLGRELWELGFFEDIVKNKANFMELKQRGHIGYENLPLRTVDGRQINVEFVCNAYEVDHQKVIQCNIRDITERKRTEEEKASLQEQLRQSQKVEAIGQLAGGIAHDFNNLLTIIQGNSKLSLMDLQEGDPLRSNMEEIEEAARRAADLTRQLLAFSRKQILEMQVLDLNQVLQRLDKMLRRVIGEDIELTMSLPESIWKVKADPGQIEQVIMNLSVNARDAMPEGGELTIETANVELDEEYAKRHIAVKPGRYVMLAVSDSGAGMTPEVREKVFEPFFTTKEKGKGTGLGLSTVYGIVKQSGGNLWVYSEPGQGTTLKIYLPQVDEPVEELKEEKIREISRGHETILIVEDEDAVRKLAVRLLKKQGYKVLEAPDGGKAFMLCEAYKEPIHLILTDVVMPGMSGRKLVDRLEVIHPEMKVLYMSGYTDNAILHHGILEPGTNFIQKPFTLESLPRKVREVLDTE